MGALACVYPFSRCLFCKVKVSSARLSVEGHNDVWELTSGRFSTMLRTSARDHPVLQPFVNKIAEIDFANKSYEDWLRQFQAYEDDENFKAQLKIMQSGAGRPATRSQM